MNFDELKKQWDQQTGDTINIKEESMRKTNSIIETIRKNFKKEVIYSSIAIVILTGIPFFENLNEITVITYYFLLMQTTVISLISFRKFYAFTQMTKDQSAFNSKESLLKVYYELKFAIDTYQSLSYSMIIPTIILYFILIGREQANDWLLKYYHFSETLHHEPLFFFWNLLGLAAFLAFVLIYSNRTVKKRYGKPLQEIKQVLDALDE